MTRQYTIEFEKDANDKWIAEVLELPGVMAYGKTREEAQARVEILALNVLFERLKIKKHERLAKHKSSYRIARTPANRMAHKAA